MTNEILLERAQLLLEQKRHKDAETYIKQALAQDPDNDYILGLLGRCYINAKEYDKGIEAVQKAIAIDPNDSFYFYLLGFAFYQKDERLQAITNLRKAIALNPYQAEYFGMLAFSLIDDRAFELGLEKANEGLALEADNLTCLNARSRALNKLKRVDAAFETMNTALAQDPDNEVTHNNIGWNLLERGEQKTAAVHFREALRINPNSVGAQAGLKESLKSKLLLYKWLLQYSFWVNNKGKRFGFILPFALYIAFRVLSKTAEGNASTASLSWVLGGLYLLVVVLSWTIGSLANFVLLFHPQGKHALLPTERWSAILVVVALTVGALLAIAGLTLTDTGNSDYINLMIPAALLSISLALPLGNIKYPLHFKQATGRQKFGIVLVVTGVSSLLVFLMAPSVALMFFAAYALGFVAYNWSGLFK